MQNRGERRSSSSPSNPHNNSTSLRRLLVLLAIGVMTSGDDGWGCDDRGGHAVCTDAYSGDCTFMPWTVTTTAAAPPSSGGSRGWCWQAASDGDELNTSGMAMQCIVYTMRAIRPLTRHRSYSAEKSTVETAGCGVKHAGSSTLAHMPPLTMLAHVAGKTGGRGAEKKRLAAGNQPAQLARLLPRVDTRITF
jgi:hypothetical protein